MKKSFLTIYLTILSISLNAQTWQDTLVKIENIFNRYKIETPGCQLSISRNGHIIFSKAWGGANLEHNIPVSTNSIIEAGSVSKQFTAASILLLEQQGRLSLNDDVRKYIPELPDYGSTIKIKNLIHHTSGLRDWGSIAIIAGWPRTTKAYSNEDALYIICQQNKLNNKPGDEVIYSNSNYNLLAIIVERISKTSLAEFTNKYIFEPAKMKNTQWRDNYKKIVPNRAIAYEKLESGYETHMPNENVYGNGGLLTTSEDLLKWNDFYLNGKFGNPSLLQRQLSPDTLNNGTINNYAAALYVQKKNGQLCIYHSGSTAGYRCYLENYPQLKLSIAYLSNTSEYGFNAVKEIENIFINDNQDKKEIKQSKTNSELVELTGWYRNEKSGKGILFITKNKELNMFGSNALTQTNLNTFTFEKTIYIFNKGRIQVIAPNDYDAGMIDTTIYSMNDTAKLSEQNVNEYLGEYYSSEAQTSLSIILKNNKLIIVQIPNKNLVLRPTYLDGFYISDINSHLYFERDENNKMKKMKISTERARNVEFVKTKH